MDIIKKIIKEIPTDPEPYGKKMSEIKIPENMINDMSSSWVTICAFMEIEPVSVIEAWKKKNPANQKPQKRSHDEIFTSGLLQRYGLFKTCVFTKKL